MARMDLKGQGSRARVAGISGLSALTLLLPGCSDPPPAEEPTGEAAEQAWVLAVGENRLDATIAHIYSLALNSREAPTVVEQREGTPGELLSGLDGEDGYEILITRSMLLAEELDPEGYEELTTRAVDGTSVSAAAAPDDLLDLIGSSLNGAEALSPAEAVIGNSLVITSITAELHEIETDADAGDPAFAEACDDLELGVRHDLPEPELLLSELYDCEPAEIIRGDESELMQMVIHQELDAAIVTASHPGIREHALITLSDTERAFPQEQYLPVVSSAVAEDVPDVVNEISSRLDGDALVELRRLIDGENGLDPQEAAEYWLVEQGLVAEPETWG